MNPPVPELAAEHILEFPLPVDIDEVIAPILMRSMESPIISMVSAEQLFSALPAALPRQKTPLNAVLTEIEGVAVEHSRRNAHPGFFGYIAGPGLPTDPLGHALTAALNQNVIGYPGAPGATVIERTLVGWLRQLSGLPPVADGMICSGGSIANLSALTVALYACLGSEYIEMGITGYNQAKPVIVVARTTHFSVQRAAVLLGLGVDQVIAVDCDDRFCMRPDALEQTLERCTVDGLKPVCVVASAGATLTGSIDPLGEIADICKRRQIWFHVDAAYGGAGLLSEDLRPKFSGIERADSVCMDLHKWFYLAFDGSVLLFRHPELARNVFYTRSDYVRFPKTGTAEEHMFFHFGPELSRRFRALPAYLAFRYYGGDTLGHNVLHNHQCAVYLARLVDRDPEMDLVCEPDLSICCFRYNPAALAGDPDRVGRLNEKIRQQLQAQGDYFMSSTVVEQRPILRVCIVSHTTRAKHIEALVDKVREIGGALLTTPEFIG